MLRLKVCTTIASLLVGLISRPRHPAAEPHSLLYEFHFTCLFVCKCFLFFAEDNPEDAKKRRHTSNQPAPQPLSLHPASCLCLHPPRALLSRHQSILRGVNSRGVGVRESPIVHCCRMCLGGRAAWPPPVCVLAHILPLHGSPCLLTRCCLEILYCISFPLSFSSIPPARLRKTYLFKRDRTLALGTGPANTWQAFFLKKNKNPF